MPPIKQLLASRQLRWAGHVARMDTTRAPRMLLTAFVQNKRPKGRPVQTFGHSLKKFLKLRANSMTVKQLKQNIDIQINSELKRITGSELKAALLKTSKSAKTDELTWIDITQDRDIWRMVVLNSFDVKSMMHRKTFESRRDYNITINGVTRNAYEKIHEDIPRRPKTTKKSSKQVENVTKKFKKSLTKS